LVKEGKVRAIGLSNETPWGVSEYLRLAREKGLTRVSTIQNQYSLLNRTFEIGLSEMCLRENIGLLPYSILSMGVLTGKYFGGARPAGARFTLFARNQERYNPLRAQIVIGKYIEVAKKYNLSPAAMAVAFAMGRSFTTSAILGATSVDQLKEVIAVGSHPLPLNVLSDIEAIYQEYPDPTA
jgi:aryl-alcohol dehydrogenase-like predicted oxidoreductase